MAFTLTRTNWQPDGKSVTTSETLGVGTTLSAKNETVQVMSDIWESQLYVTYWDAEAGKPAGAFLTNNEEVTIDYTPEALKAYVSYMAKMKYESALENAVAYSRRTRLEVTAGKTVKITGGRPKPGVVVGKEYVVFHVMDRTYGQGYHSSVRPMAGIALDAEKHDVVGKNGKTYQSYKNVAWVWAHNTEVVGAEDAIAADLPGNKAHAKEIMGQYVTGLLASFTNTQRKVA